MDAASLVLYPLPESRLPQVYLSPSDIDQWKSEARDIVQDIVRNRQSWYFRFRDHQYLYKPVYAKHSTHGCMRVIKRTKTMEFMSRGELNMTLDEVAYSLHCTTSAEQRAVYAQLYQNSCLDGALLRLFEDRTPTDPFHTVAVKWIALRSPKSKILHTRDFVFFEYCFTTTDALGRKVLIEFKKSQRFRPDQLHNHDLDVTRGRMFMLNTYYMEDDHVVMQSLGRHSVRGNCPVWFASTVMPIVFERVHNHHGLVFTRSLADAGMTVNSLADPRSYHATACRVCRKRFKWTRGKKWCRGCGHAVCRDCVTDVIHYNDKITSAFRLPYTHEQFCSLCRFHMREHKVTTDNAAAFDEHNCWLSNIPEEEPNALELSHISAAVHSIDQLLGQRAADPMDEPILLLSMATLDGGNQDQTTLSRRTTRSSSMSNAECDVFSCPESKTPSYEESIELIYMAREAADQAAMLRSIYRQECQRWRQQMR